MNWFRNIFAEKKQEDGGPSEVAVRATEIQARIAAFRSSYPWTEQSDKNTKVQPNPMVAQEELKINTTKSTEMDALKAKLLGKKK
jgi:hypothetical protein